MTRALAEITLSKDAHELIAAETTQCLPFETGGILLGYREDARIIVTHALAVGGAGASAHKYVRDDLKANALLDAFLANRDSGDPTGYIGEWHSHSAPIGPSQMDIDTMRRIAKTSDSPIALVVHAPRRTNSFLGVIAQRQTLGRVAVKEATVILSSPRFPPLGPLPDGAVRGDGPVFISYRQSDGTECAESLEKLLRAAGLVVWRDRSDLRPGTTTDRLEQALTQGLSGAVLIVTPEIAHSEIIRERELPRLLQLDENPAFSLCIANNMPRSKDSSKCDYNAPDRLLRLAPARTLADKKQSNVRDPAGQMEIVRDLVMHRVEQIKADLVRGVRPFRIRVQSRPDPFAVDAGHDDVHIRIKPTGDGRLPSRTGLESLRLTLPVTSDGVHASGTTTVRISGGAHLSVALALGAALPETKIGDVEVLDARKESWTSWVTDDPELHKVQIETLRRSHAGERGRPPRVAAFVSLTADPDRTAFDQLIGEDTEGFTATTVVTLDTAERIDPREAARLSVAVAREIKHLAASYGRAEVHLAFHGPYTMAVLVGRYLNTLRTVVYEWDHLEESGPTYKPVLVLEPGAARGPITEILL